MVAISYLNRKGGRISNLTSLISAFFNFVHARRITISARYVDSQQNVVADTLFRAKPAPADWKLEPELFKEINNLWGPSEVEVDLFASF